MLDCKLRVRGSSAGVAEKAARRRREVARPTCCRCPLWTTRKTPILGQALSTLFISCSREVCEQNNDLFCSPTFLLLNFEYPSNLSSKTFGDPRHNLSEWNLFRRLLCHSVPRRLLRLSQRGRFLCRLSVSLLSFLLFSTLPTVHISPRLSARRASHHSSHH